MISDEQAATIIELSKQGKSQREISELTKVARHTISDVIAGRWRGHKPALQSGVPDWMPEDYGQQIPGSRWVRNYCRACRSPGRTEIACYWVCECQGKVLTQRVVRNREPIQWWERLG